MRIPVHRLRLLTEIACIVVGDELTGLPESSTTIATHPAVSGWCLLQQPESVSLGRDLSRTRVGWVRGVNVSLHGMGEAFGGLGENPRQARPVSAATLAAAAETFSVPVAAMLQQ